MVVTELVLLVLVDAVVENMLVVESDVVVDTMVVEEFEVDPEVIEEMMVVVLDEIEELTTVASSKDSRIERQTEPDVLVSRITYWLPSVQNPPLPVTKMSFSFSVFQLDKSFGIVSERPNSV